MLIKRIMLYPEFKRPLDTKGLLLNFITLGKKKAEDVEEEPEEVIRAREDLAAKRAKFPGLCLPDDTKKAEVVKNVFVMAASMTLCRNY